MVLVSEKFCFSWALLQSQRSVLSLPELSSLYARVVGSCFYEYKSFTILYVDCAVYMYIERLCFLAPRLFPAVSALFFTQLTFFHRFFALSKQVPLITVYYLYCLFTKFTKKAENNIVMNNCRLLYEVKCSGIRNEAM